MCQIASSAKPGKVVEKLYKIQSSRSRLTWHFCRVRVWIRRLEVAVQESHAHIIYIYIYIETGGAQLYQAQPQTPNGPKTH